MKKDKLIKFLKDEIERATSLIVVSARGVISNREDPTLFQSNLISVAYHLGEYDSLTHILDRIYNGEFDDNKGRARKE